MLKELNLEVSGVAEMYFFYVRLAGLCFTEDEKLVIDAACRTAFISIQTAHHYSEQGVPDEVQSLPELQSYHVRYHKSRSIFYYKKTLRLSQDLTFFFSCIPPYLTYLLPRYLQIKTHTYIIH